jgi:hypothetical protein
MELISLISDLNYQVLASARGEKLGVTVYSVQLRGLCDVISIPIDLKICTIERGDGGQLWAWKFTQRMEVESRKHDNNPMNNQGSQHP